MMMKLDGVFSDNGSALPLPLAGESLPPTGSGGWGGGASAKRAARVDRLPPPATLWRAIALPSVSTSPARGRGEENQPMKSPA